MITYNLVVNEEQRQYEFHIKGYIPKIEYFKTNNGEIYLTHTEVPYPLEGQGIGTELVVQTLGHIEKEGLRLVPLCPFVVDYIKRNPQWRKIVMKGEII